MTKITNAAEAWGKGIHWPDLDEDISAAGLLAGRGDQTRVRGTGA